VGLVVTVEKEVTAEMAVTDATVPDREFRMVETAATGMFHFRDRLFLSPIVNFFCANTFFPTADEVPMVAILAWVDMAATEQMVAAS